MTEAPLRTLRADLGLEEQGRKPNTVRVDQAEVLHKIEAATAQIEEQGKLLAELQRDSGAARAACYVKNDRSEVVHALRARDAAHTACGWPVGAAEQRRRGVTWLRSVRNLPWKKMCDRCMIPERNALRMMAPIDERDSDSD